jgi:hypothetical protein
MTTADNKICFIVATCSASLNESLLSYILSARQEHVRRPREAPLSRKPDTQR